MLRSSVGQASGPGIEPLGVLGQPRDWQSRTEAGGPSLSRDRGAPEPCPLFFGTQVDSKTK